MKSLLIFLLLFSFSALHLFGAEKTFLKMSLKEAEMSAIKNSDALKSFALNVESSQSQVETSKAQELPNLSLQGSYNYQTEVPRSGPITFGTHNNYAIGPVLTYTLFDKGKEEKLTSSFEQLSKSKSENYLAYQKQMALKVRQIYFQTQYAAEELRLVRKSLQIAKDQGHDIRLRFGAGSVSRLDSIESQREVISYELKFKIAELELAKFKRELMAITKINEESQWELDSLKDSLATFEKKNYSGPNENHPDLKSLQLLAESNYLAASSERAGLWPRLQFMAKSQYIYPDVVIPKNVIQNTVGVTLTIPLFEGEATKGRASSRQSEAMSFEYQKKQKMSDLLKDFSKGQDSLKSLQSQDALSEVSVREAQKVVELTYQSYKAGKIRYLDLQNANLKLLQAEVQAAQIKSSILMEAAVLDYLSQEKE